MRTIMKKIIKSLLFIISFAVVVSCADESLDPLNMSTVKKGTILALRGTQLENIYFNGLPGYEIFPKAIDGTETFQFDAEILSTDPSTLQSFDIYAVKRTKVGSSVSTERVLLKNVAASEFQKTDDYLNPWVTVTIDMDAIFTAIGENPSSPGFAEKMLDVYGPGISIVSDLNLADGSVISSDDLVAAGLFQSNQFYPAQRLTIAVTNYCPEDLEGTYSFQTTVTAVGSGGSLAGCAGGVSGDGEIVNISRGKYSISDVSFGQYDCAWGDDPATGATLVNTCNELTFGGADQYDLIYTIENAQVSGDGTQLSFKWSNDYGDAGTTVLTRTDGKTWPLELYSD
jgi:hypothetical protein